MNMPAPQQAKKAEQAQDNATSPAGNYRAEYAEQKQKEVSPAQAVSLIKEVQELTGKQLPVISTSTGGKVQIVSPLDDGGFFLCHDPHNQDPRGFEQPVEYFFDGKGSFQRASKTTDRRDSSAIAQELLVEIRNYIEGKKREK